MQILIGTGNAGKIMDLREALEGLQLELLQPSDADIFDTPHEEGDTFRANALQKALFYRERSGLPTLADDSGIHVEALGNELGIHTRRWGAGPGASDEEWVTYFLERMKREENKRARFVCCLCFIDEMGTEHFFEGTCDGVITETVESPYAPGLPIAGCFKPDGAESVYAGMSIDDKNTISHRGRAVGKLSAFLRARQSLAFSKREA